MDWIPYFNDGNWSPKSNNFCKFRPHQKHKNNGFVWLLSFLNMDVSTIIFHSQYHNRLIFHPPSPPAPPPSPPAPPPLRPSATTMMRMRTRTTTMNSKMSSRPDTILFFHCSWCCHLLRARLVCYECV